MEMKKRTLVVGTIFVAIAVAMSVFIVFIGDVL